MERKNLTNLSRNLRKNSTDAERQLWSRLKAKQLNGLKFRRQAQIGDYIADFVCFECRLVIELDGGQHALNSNKDLERDAWLESQGFNVLRFWNNDVIGNLDGIIQVIDENTINRIRPE